MVHRTREARAFDPRLSLEHDGQVRSLAQHNGSGLTDAHLLDDLQDVEADLAAGHETLFTRAARQGSLDESAARLGCFLDSVLLRNGRFDGPAFADRLDLLRRNCLALLVGSVAETPTRFSRRFRRDLERQSPVSLRARRRLRRRALARWSRAQSALAVTCVPSASGHSTVTLETLDALVGSATDR